jgi:hypothetical protein
MRIAWFAGRSTADAHPLDDTRSLLDELAHRRHVVELYDQARAHDFVWQQWRRPFDACVYELSDSTASAFIWPYLLHYPGIVRLRSSRLRASRRRWLRHHRRTGDDRTEALFAGSDALRIPLTAARLVVVGDPCAAQALQDVYPWARIRHAVVGFAAPVRAARLPQRTVPVIGLAAAPSRELVLRAVQRARAAGSVMDLRVDLPTASTLADCDAVVALEWPPRPEPPPGALFAMAAGRPAVVYEVPATAAWPALDPQTWGPRGSSGREPIVISLDARDDEHSLMLALRRLAGDAALRQDMGRAAGAWSQSAATVPHAADAWDRIVAEAATLEPPPRPADWPAHLTADGTARARELLAEMGVAFPL